MIWIGVGLLIVLALAAGFLVGYEVSGEERLRRERQEWAERRYPEHAHRFRRGGSDAA